MKSPLARRLGVLTVGALVTTGLAVSGGGTAQAVPASGDPSPARSGAAWLAGKLSSGAFQPIDQSNLGLAIDAALSFRETGQQTGAIPSINAAVANNLPAYWDYTAPGYSNRAAGAVAKTLAMAQVAGADARNYGPGAVNVVSQLEDLTAADGRISDVTLVNGQPDPTGDCANVVGQSFAARGLTAFGSGEAAAATSYLLSEQEPAGYFPLGLTGITCVDDALPNVDATALVVINLQAAKSAPAVATALAKATTWLASQQAANGSFIDSTDAFASGTNANSTGLAGWALGLMGQDAAAAKTAGWLRGHQLANAGTCTPYAATDSGAVAPDDTTYAAATPGPLSAGASASFVRATAQVLPALQWAAGGSAAGENTLTYDEFAKAGTPTATVTLTGAPGNTLCATVGGVATKKVLGADGAATFALSLPAKKGQVALTVVDAGGETDTAAVTVLPKKTVRFQLKAKALKTGTKTPVKVRGLKPGESITVKLRGKKVVTTANAKGRKTVRIKVTGKPGTAVIKVKGEFGFRSGKTTVRVVR